MQSRKTIPRAYTSAIQIPDSETDTDSFPETDADAVNSTSEPHHCTAQNHSTKHRAYPPKCRLPIQDCRNTVPPLTPPTRHAKSPPAPSEFHNPATSSPNLPVQKF
ncbi:hypothetical protein M758_7G048500 [Ceratodon purpureus]|uniref:Uncharacterized protein n=1 Tax=Ceratodon purpureus TaxID=3225 RepID=A0A8T0H7C3_CERPU|nr:hypothetical protein KC19_7G051400 [Ceratodon purpureus]KAG0610226.1 hypothetical protein M758_7G048500 [Ceratodon purpureus]